MTGGTFPEPLGGGKRGLKRDTRPARSNGLVALEDDSSEYKVPRHARLRVQQVTLF